MGNGWNIGRVVRVVLGVREYVELWRDMGNKGYRGDLGLEIG